MPLEAPVTRTVGRWALAGLGRGAWRPGWLSLDMGGIVRGGGHSGARPDGLAQVGFRVAEAATGVHRPCLRWPADSQAL